MPNNSKPLEAHGAPELPGAKPLDPAPSKPKSSAKSSNSLQLEEPESEATDQAVEDIVKHESDELLAFEDAKQSLSPEQVWQPKRSNTKFGLLLIAIILILVAVPNTRYRIFGLFWQQNYTVAVYSQAHQPISGASILLDGKIAITDNQGKASLRVKVGHTTLSISKKSYKTLTQKILIPIIVKNISGFSLESNNQQGLLPFNFIKTGA